jgi:hypothetical protein
MASGLAGLALFAGLVVTTFGGCWLFYQLAVHSGPMREWLGLGSRRKRWTEADAAPAAAPLITDR